jgi:hypothetical protein
LDIRAKRPVSARPSEAKEQAKTNLVQRTYTTDRISQYQAIADEPPTLHSRAVALRHSQLVYENLSARGEPGCTDDDESPVQRFRKYAPVAFQVVGHVRFQRTRAVHRDTIEEHDFFR